ncbi:hypothetical protein [Hyphomicrobium methylovorum]|uniref:hypothetical protein n=1 Tax=Hyphomicrobium methylovorum TaxID=84 RepID=UPI0015E69E9F|nr:hypothetical protein [Hyphomicrobium methylovorum]
MQSDCAKIDEVSVTSQAEQNGINYANIIRAYIAHVLTCEGTHFICFDEDIAALSLSDAEAAELARLRDEVDDDR